MVQKTDEMNRLHPTCPKYSSYYLPAKMKKTILKAILFKYRLPCKIMFPDKLNFSLVTKTG